MVKLETSTTKAYHKGRTYVGEVPDDVAKELGLYESQKDSKDSKSGGKKDSK